MYHSILIPLENTATDRVILNHIQPLATLCKSTLLLVHVADGFVARNQNTMNLAESEEILKDREYLERTMRDLQKLGFTVRISLLCGEPAEEIQKLATNEKCDLIAMATHGHRFFKDIILGSVADKIRHTTTIPVLMVRA